MTRQRIVTIVLIVSLAVNILIIGALIGRWVRHSDASPFPPHFGWLIRGLDEETRRDLRPVIRQQAEQLIPLRREMRAAQRRFNDALTTEPLDEAALDAALADLRETTEAFQAAMHDQMLTVIKRMDPEERARIVRYLERRGPGDRHDHRDKPRP